MGAGNGDAAFNLKNKLGALYVLETNNNDACTGFVCCPSQHAQVSGGEVFPTALTSFLSPDEYLSLIHKINYALKVTAAPVFPCLLCHVFGGAYLMFMSTKRLRLVKEAVEEANRTLYGKQMHLHWLMHPVHEGKFMISLNYIGSQPLKGRLY